MYLEFTLPSGSAGMAAGYTRQSISRNVSEVANDHGIIWKSNTVGYRYYIQFEKPEDYTMFALVWQTRVKNSWHQYRVIDGEMPARKDL